MARVRGTGHQVSIARPWRCQAAVSYSWKVRSAAARCIDGGPTRRQTKASCLSWFGKTCFYEWWWSNCVMDGGWTSAVKSVKNSCKKKSKGNFALSASECKENIDQKYPQVVCTVVVVLFIFQARTNAYITCPTHKHLSYTNGRHA